MGDLKQIMQRLKTAIDNSTTDCNASFCELTNWLARHQSADPEIRAKAIDIAMMLNGITTQHNALVDKIVQTTEVKA